MISDPPISLFDRQGLLRGELLATPQGFPHHHVEPTPEPGTWVMLLAGAVLLAAGRRPLRR